MECLLASWFAECQERWIFDYYHASNNVETITMQLAKPASKQHVSIYSNLRTQNGSHTGANYTYPLLKNDETRFNWNDKLFGSFCGKPPEPARHFKEPAPPSKQWSSNNTAASKTSGQTNSTSQYVRIKQRTTEAALPTQTAHVRCSIPIKPISTHSINPFQLK